MSCTSSLHLDNTLEVLYDLQRKYERSSLYNLVIWYWRTLLWLCSRGYSSVMFNQSAREMCFAYLHFMYMQFTNLCEVSFQSHKTWESSSLHKLVPWYMGGHYNGYAGITLEQLNLSARELYLAHLHAMQCSNMKFHPNRIRCHCEYYKNICGQTKRP